ncbi:hypothetical protein HYC85_031035 [Camellia sinensis]|uniref:Uncharacterized protein n=1 Tax=Camellia sinensis TaxID=4442 RepID=A0A7J7FPW4_CAMSI|nr:hypothetical protein HYC85_031035 [Camellia sinensis]
MELQLGNSVNSQMKHNLCKNSVPDDMKLQLTSNIAREYTLSLEPPLMSRTLCHNASRWLPTYSFSKKNCETRKKDQSLDLIVHLQFKTQPLSTLMTWKISYQTKKISEARMKLMRRNALIKKDAACIKYDGLLRENKVNYQNIIVKGEISMHNSCNSRHDHQGEIEEDEESKPRFSYVHPKLPDYDELVATFTVQE